MKRRRLVAAGTSGLLLALSLAAAGVVTALGERFHARVDVTTTGEQRLAPRTRAILDVAAPLGEVEIVVAVDASTLEPWSRRTVRDVLDLFEHAGGVRASEIDVGSASGQAEYGRLIERLIERERAGIDEHAAALASAGASASEGAARLEQQVAPSLLALRDMLGEGDEASRRAMEQWAAVARLGSRRLGDAGAAAAGVLTEPTPGVPIPPLAEQEAALRKALDDRARELETLVEEVGRLAASGDGRVRAACESLAEGVRGIRDALARASDSLDRLPKLDILRVARAIGAAEVALVIGPPGTGVAGIDIGTLYEPRVVASDGTRVTGDVRFQAEELFASAISSVLSGAKPIVVLTHGESASILETSALFNGVRERLAQRGIDMIEWRTLKEEDPPGLRALDPEGLRPVVYATLAPDSSAAARSEEDVPGPERATALGRAIARLVGERAAILLSVNPSVLPSYGEADPVAAPLRALGIEIATGTPLLREVVSARAREVDTELELSPEEGTMPLLAAARNLRTLLPWAIPVRMAEGSDGLRATALLVAPDDGSVWGESQWLRLWQTPRGQRSLLPEKPEFDEGVDDGAGPWTVALAAERTDGAPGSRAGRLVVVGSNGWYSDPAAFQHQTTDGRVSLSYAGNAELFEASVLWLAGQDELIAQSAVARATALVGPIAPENLSRLRWALVAGLPVLTLALGVVWRVVRG